MFVRNLLILSALVVLLSVPGWPAGNVVPVFTQKNLAHLIVDRFGWGDGLPKEPADRDYLVILNGRRSFRFEAENAYNPNTDRVTIAEYSQYGPFSGKGWLMGVSEKTDANFTVHLPIGGRYTLKAVLSGKEFVWRVEDREYRAGSPTSGFKEVVIGEVDVKAGVLQMKVTLPPQGGIDSFVFAAPDYRPIQPLVGWRFREPLTAERLAEVGMALMNLYAQLPEEKQDVPNPVEAADAALPTSDAVPVNITYFGRFSSRSWLRADIRGATLQVPFKVKHAGFYSLRARVMGRSLEGDVNGYGFAVSGKPYLEMTELGLFRLESGDNMLTLRLPPMGGLDLVEFGRKSCSPADFMRLTGVSGAPDRPVGREEAQAFLRTVSEKYPVRK
jgi:hypothetical protein